MRTLILTLWLMFVEVVNVPNFSNFQTVSSTTLASNVVKVDVTEQLMNNEINSVLVNLNMYHLFSETDKNKVNKIAKKFNINPIWLYKIFYLESGGIVYKQNKSSLATGLIGFLPSTARYLGTNIDDLAKMTIEQQLTYVDKYLSIICKDKHIRSFDDLYLSVFHPAAIGKKEAYVISSYPKKAYVQNKSIDLNKDGILTVADVTAFVSKRLSKI